jgi:hypothetical protein
MPTEYRIGFRWALEAVKGKYPSNSHAAVRSASTTLHSRPPQDNNEFHLTEQQDSGVS